MINKLIKEQLENLDNPQILTPDNEDIDLKSYLNKNKDKEVNFILKRKKLIELIVGKKYLIEFKSDFIDAPLLWMEGLIINQDRLQIEMQATGIYIETAKNCLRCNNILNSDIDKRFKLCEECRYDYGITIVDLIDIGDLNEIKKFYLNINSHLIIQQKDIERIYNEY